VACGDARNTCGMMQMLVGLPVSLLASGEVGRELGKKGTESDLVFFNSKRGDTALTYMLPARYPERVQGLGFSLTTAREVVFEIEEVNVSLGEKILAAGFSGKKRGHVLLKNYVQPEDVRALFRDAGMDVSFYSDTTELRLAMEEIASGVGNVEKAGNGGVVVVDQSFSVRGVGTVVLGFVVEGAVKKHDEIVVFPGGKKALVRSIQVQDIDRESVGSGVRVGLALRGVEPEEAARGCVLASPNREVEVVPVGEKRVVSLEKTRFWRGNMGEGTVFHICSGFQFVPVRVVGDVAEVATKSGGAGSVEMPVVFEKAFVRTSLPALVFHLDSKPQRVVGRMAL